jgi:hypothetical protein
MKGNQSVLNRLSALSELSSQTYSQLTDEARNTINNTLSRQIEALGGSVNQGSLSSPRLSNEVNKLMEITLQFGADSPRAQSSARNVAELYTAGQQDLNLTHKLELIQHVGNLLNRSTEMKTVFCNYPNFPVSILELINEVAKANDPLKLWNLNSLLSALTNSTNLGEKHLCSIVSSEYLESLTTNFTKNALTQRYPHLIDSDIIFAILAQSNSSLNPNDNSSILNYLATVDNQRMDSNSRILVTDGFKQQILSAFIKKAENYIGDTSQNAHVMAKLINFGLTPSKQTIMNMYVENDTISWNTLVNHNPILNISTLGVLTEPILKFYSTYNVDSLCNALDIVSRNKEWFRVINLVNKEHFNLDMEFEWCGTVDNTKISCVTPENVNFLRTNIIGLEVLVHSIIHQITMIPNQNLDIGTLISKAKANTEVWKRITESVQFQFHNQTNSNYIDHIQVPENLKK